MNKIERKHTIKALIADTVRKMKIKKLTQLEVEDMISWAWEGLQLIGSAPTYTTFEKRIKLDDENKAEIPCNAIHLRRVTVENSDLDISYDMPVSVTDLLDWSSINTKFTIDWPYIKLQSPGYILEDDNTSSLPTHVTLNYQGFEVCDDGFPLIKDSHFIALPYYLGYWYWLGREGTVMNPEQLFQKWQWYCKQRRGNDSLPNLQERKYIGKMWNNMLHYTQENINNSLNLSIVI